MRYEFEYDHSDDLLRAAAKRSVRQFMSLRALVTLALVVVLVAVLCPLDGQGYLCGLIQGALGFFLLYLAMASVSGYQQALQFAQKLPTRKSRCTVTDEGLTVESALATSSAKWPVVQKVVRAPEVWLFFLARGQFFALPADKFNAEAAALIESRVTAAGGRMV